MYIQIIDSEKCVRRYELIDGVVIMDEIVAGFTESTNAPVQGPFSPNSHAIDACIGIT